MTSGVMHCTCFSWMYGCFHSYSSPFSRDMPGCCCFLVITYSFFSLYSIFFWRLVYGFLRHLIRVKQMNPFVYAHFLDEFMLICHAYISVYMGEVLFWRWCQGVFHDGLLLEKLLFLNLNETLPFHFMSRLKYCCISMGLAGAYSSCFRR